ncbi:replication initiator protein [Pontibacter ummariensis]|uniref:Initiator Replication protein n=1 Tax=Pontibacter ummariensis TaxID=1610492 RepID=A0A239LX54_9BACT|nr:replication initiation protein [Pontibacter ummariensis]PRY00206.1 replication initiator protein [Pontibacter ummariensis]SNT35041.1 Initiator Replication protein [Pontibacter ummariensis]
MTTPKPASVEIRQHNAITTARYEMTACEMDIVFYLLSLIKKEDERGVMYQVKVRDLMAITGREWHYNQFLEATSNLRSREYIIEDEKRVLQVGLLASAEYIKGEGVIELEVSEKVRPYLIDLKNNFTSFRLHAAFSLTSKYAKRIYQIASQWKDIGESKTFSIHDLKVMLMLKDPKGKDPEQYTKLSMFKKFVLDTAVNQINAHTDLKISYELIKKGRSYQSIRFYINTQAPDQLPLPFDQPVENARHQHARQILDDLGIKDAKLIQQILSDEKLTDGMFKFNYELKTGRTKASKNPAGLLLKVLGLR